MLRHRNLCADPLEFGRDLNAARYMDGKRETPNAQVSVTILYDSRLLDPDVQQPLVQVLLLSYVVNICVLSRHQKSKSSSPPLPA